MASEQEASTSKLADTFTDSSSDLEISALHEPIGSMDRVVRNGIIEILAARKEMLRIPIRQKAKFEGWLKFELASYLETIGMQSVEVETKAFYRRDRTDVTFFCDQKPYSVELKTPNTNWKVGGCVDRGRPITKNIQSVVDDALKLNSDNGIVAFVLFPIPHGDNRWKFYLERIREQTGIPVSTSENCEVLSMDVDHNNNCAVVVCTFMSKKFNNSW